MYINKKENRIIAIIFFWILVWGSALVLYVHFESNWPAIPWLLTSIAGWFGLYYIAPRPLAPVGQPFNLMLLDDQRQDRFFDNPDGTYRGRPAYLRKNIDREVIYTFADQWGTYAPKIQLTIAVALTCPTKFRCQMMARAALGPRDKYLLARLALPRQVEINVPCLHWVSTNNKSFALMLLEDARVRDHIQTLFSLLGMEELSCTDGILRCTARPGLDEVREQEHTRQVLDILSELAYFIEKPQAVLL